MSIKPRARLEQWTYHETNDPQWGRNHVLSGFVYGHHKLPDGVPITTSIITGAHGGDVETQNTVYELGEWSTEGLSKDKLLERLEVLA